MVSKIKFFHTLKIIWFLFRPYKLRLSILASVMLISGLLESLNLAALYPVINYGLDQKSQGFLLNLFNELLRLLPINSLFLASCILLIIITMLAVAMKALNYFISYKISLEIASRYQKDILFKYIHADYDFFIRNQQGKLIHTGTIASKHAASMVLYTISAANDFLSVVLMFSLLVMLTWQGAVLIIIIGLLYFLIVKEIMNKIIYRHGLLLLDADQEKNVILNELINGIKTIKVFLGFKVWSRKYNDAVDRSMIHQLKMLLGRILPDSMMKLTFYCLIAGVGILISFRTGDILPWLPLYGTFALVASRLFPAVQLFGNDLMVLIGSLPNTMVIYDLLNERTEKIQDGSRTMEMFANNILFQDIWFKFNGSEEFLFRGVNFSVEKKKMTAIVGPSGRGKTTIVNLLLRLYVPDKGHISIDGIDISEYTYKSYLSRIGYVSQDTFIYNDTIRENIKFGFENCTEDMIIEAARQADAHEFILETSQGYDTVVGDAGIKLSGGQKQRIAIARAMLRKPEILILDEATSSLDNIAEKKVQDAINRISQETTLLVIAHRLSTIQNADNIIVVDDGRIIEQGRHEELLNKRGAYFDLYNRQAVENHDSTSETGKPLS